MKRKIVILILIILVFTGITFSQIGTKIPSGKLPDKEGGLLPWQNSGCISKLGEDERIHVNKIINVETDLDTIPGNGVISKIQYIIDNKSINDTILLYFPSGEYNFGDTLKIFQNITHPDPQKRKYGSNVILKGEGSENTTLKFNHLYYMVPDGSKKRAEKNCVTQNNR